MAAACTEHLSTHHVFHVPTVACQPPTLRARAPIALDRSAIDSARARRSAPMACSFAPPLALLPVAAQHARAVRSFARHPRTRSVAMSSSAQPPERRSQPPQPLVQYVVVRRDLLPHWPVGSLIAQGVHASVAAIWQSRLTPCTTQYCSPPQSHMRTVVLAADSEHAVLELAKRLEHKGVGFALWREQPEDVVTALAAYPAPTTQVKPHFANFKLFK